MDPFVKKAGWTNSTLIKVILGALLAAGVMGIGAIAFQFSNYKQSAGIPNEGSFPSLVTISTPLNGAQFEAGESQIIEVMAIGPNKFKSIELWLNGELAGVQTAPEDGIKPFSTHFTWLPLEPGAYSLVAGAVDANGQKAMSAQVIVFIVLPKVNIELVQMDLSGAPNVLPAAPEGESDSPATPGAGTTTGPARGWSGSPGDWLNSLTAKDVPAAPELVARAGRCAANLLIHDLSDNEEGFIVYRQTINSPSWLKVATLSSQSQADWLEYTDEGLSGGVTYYVSAFNSQGAADSNLQLVNISMDDCSQEGEGIGVGSVDVAIQIPNQEAERMYCYFSTDGTNWARWPQFGFLSFDENGALPIVPVMRVGQSSSGEEPALPHLNLLMDCWGWQGGELKPLGNISVEGLSPQINGGQAVEGEGISAQLMYSSLNLQDLFPFEPEGDLPMDPISFQQGLLTPINPDIPRVYLYLVKDPQECIEYLPPEAQNPLGALLYCFPYPQFDPDQGGTPPQPYLGWTFTPEPHCINGVSETCLSYQELQVMAEETGGQVGFEVAALSSKGMHSWMVTEPWLRMFVVPPVSCAGDMRFNVRMWYQPGNEGVAVSASPDDELMESDEFILSNIPDNEVLYGPFSNPVTIPCQPMSVNVDGKILFKQYLDITFDSVYFIFTDDGEDESLELYGYFRVIAPSMGQLQEEHCFLEGLLPCDDDDEYFWEGPYYAHTRRNLLVADWEEDEDLKKFIIKGSYDLRNWELCQSTNKFSCLYEGQATSYKTGNNTLRVFVTEGEALTFEVNLVDYDELSADDVACHTTYMTPSRTLEQWADLEDKHVQFGSEWGSSGRCIVVAYINAVNP